MQKSNVTVSIIIVHYKVQKELLECIQSIYHSKPHVAFEIIVVDNDEIKIIEKPLLKKFPAVCYIANKKNNGWGGGTNVGAKYARGEYLYFLNPDTKVTSNALDEVYKVIKTDKKIGVCASLLLNNHNLPYELQGSLHLTPIRALILYSFINKFLPGNWVAKNFWYARWNKKTLQRVDVAPLTASMMRKEIFNKINGLDENFFLYFEEYDIAQKVRRLGYYNFIVPSSKVIHLWERSSQERSDIQKIFTASRKTYFEKYFGKIVAMSTEILLNLKKHHGAFLLIICAAFFIRLYKVSELMPFIGDTAWFYISARDMLQTGIVPQVGITSSHTWLHQGPLWTYFLSLGLAVFHFSPVSGAYISILFGIGSVILAFLIGRMYSSLVGFIFMLLMAFSPLAIIHSRMPYHTSPIPFFALLLFFSLIKWTQGNRVYLYLTFLTLGILYNLELASVSLWFVIIGFILYGILRKYSWIGTQLRYKTLLLGFLLFSLPMLPIYIYDASHGFLQTIGFATWMGYKVISIGTIFQSGMNGQILQEMTRFLFEFNQRLIFLPHGIVACMIVIICMGIFFTKLIQNVLNKKEKTEYVLIGLWISFSLGIFIINKTPSEAYLPLFYPVVLLLCAVVMDYIAARGYRFAITLLITGIVISNTMTLFSQNYLMGESKGYGPSFTSRMRTAKYIVEDAQGRPYNIIGVGEGAEFESFTMNYEYLTWYLGNQPSKKTQQLRMFIAEKDGKIILYKKEFAY